MTLSDRKTFQSISAKKVLSRFAHLLSAQGMEGIFSTLFFLYLAWVNAQVYGQVMYALAVGTIVAKVVHYGLYYTLVGYLSKTDKADIPEVLNRTNAIKVALLLASMIAVWVFCSYRDFSGEILWIVVLVALGCGLEMVADTYFADLRIRGLQKTEARTRVVSSVASYGYGLAAAALGASPVIVAGFRMVSGIVRLVFVLSSLWKEYGSRLLVMPRWRAAWIMVRATTVFAGFEVLSIIYNKTNVLFMEASAGIDGVALYSAAYNLVEPVSVLASEQLLSWVIFPILATMWSDHRDHVAPLVRRTAQWLIVLALPAMFVLWAESGLLVGLIYPPKLGEAANLQKYLVWAILFSFESNLFIYLMMVAGGARALLAFSAITTILNLLMNVALTGPLGLTGGCLVIVLTKMLMTIFSLVYCQLKVGVFKATDGIFPAAAAMVTLLLFLSVEPWVTLHPAVLLTLAMYFLLIWRYGPAYLGRVPWQKQAA